MEAVSAKGRELSIDSVMKFRCSPGLPCFTQCCRDVTIILTPYDIIRLKKRLGIGSGMFLAQYTATLIPEMSGFPLILLKMRDDEHKTCPFVSPSGCSVYEDRPWPCRMFPLDRSDTPGTFRIIADPEICCGLAESDEQTVEQYRTNQGVEIYEDMEIPFQRIVMHPRLERAPIRSEKARDLCRMALYDLDRFRKYVLESGFQKLFNLSDAVMKAIEKDDVALMQLGCSWTAFSILGEETAVSELNASMAES